MTPAEVPILIVDDVQTVRVQLKEILRDHGFANVKSATNGIEALQMLNENPFSLVISDMHMAPMTGIDLVKEVRSKDKLKEIGFIMLTAESTKEKVVEAIKSGIDDYIMKPFKTEHCQLKVIGVLMKRKFL